MATSYLDFIWTSVKAIFVTLGGFAGVTKIFEWLFRGPKIIGHINTIVQSHTSRECRDAHLLLNIYLVNKRIQPITLERFVVYARVRGKWLRGEMLTIPDGFTMPSVPEIAFSKARLYEVAALNLLEYGKGIRGWLRVTFEGVDMEEVSDAHLRIELTDAFNHKHVIKHTRQSVPSKEVDFFPGAGISQGSARNRARDQNRTPDK